MKRALVILGTIVALCVAQGLILSRYSSAQITTFQADQNFIANLVTQVTNNVIATLQLAGDVVGRPSSTTVVRIQNIPVSATAPTNLQVLQYQTSANAYVPSAAGGAAGPLNLADYGATGDGTTDDTAAIQSWLNALCANPQLRGYVPTASKCYKTTAPLFLNCSTVVDTAGWLDSSWGNTQSAVSDPTTYVTGAVLCPKQTQDVELYVRPTNNEGGSISNLFVAGSGSNSTPINIGSGGISEVHNVGGVAPAGGTVTVNVPSHGLPPGHSTAVTIAGVTTQWTLSGETQVGQVVTAVTTTPHGMTVPQDNVWTTIAGSNVTGYNGTKLTITAAGPCAKTSTSCGWRQTPDVVLNGTTTITSATMNFQAGDAGAAIAIDNGLAAGGYLVTTIASVTNSTTAVLASCGAGCATGTSPVTFLYQALTNEQFQYVLAATGLSAGTGGTITQVGQVAGGLTYNGTWYATYKDANNLTFYSPFAGLGTITSTGTATLGAIGVSIGDGGAGSYASGFSTYHLGVANSMMGFGTLEQNAKHELLSIDRTTVPHFMEWNASFTNNNLHFDEEKIGAQQAHMNLQSFAPAFDNTWTNLDSECPNSNDTTAVGLAVYDGQLDKFANIYSEMQCPATTWTGEGVDLGGVFNQANVRFEGGLISEGAAGNSAPDMHIYAGGGTVLKSLFMYDNITIEPAARITVLDHSVYVTKTDNGFSTVNWGSGPALDPTLLGGVQWTFDKGFDITGGDILSDPAASGFQLTQGGVTVDGMFYDSNIIKFGPAGPFLINAGGTNRGQVGVEGIGTNTALTPFYVNALVGQTGTIQEWRVNGSEVSNIQADGSYGGPAIHVGNSLTQNATLLGPAAAVTVTLTSPSSSGTLALAGTGTSGGIFPHTLTGATPVAAVNSATTAAIDVENLVLSVNVTSYTLPASSAVADGEILHVKISQSASGGPYTLHSGTVGPFTAGSGTIVSALSTVTCPTIGTTQSSTVPSEFWADIIYYAPLTEWVVTACADIR